MGMGRQVNQASLSWTPGETRGPRQVDPGEMRLREFVPFTSRIFSAAGISL